jgi:hypothetical protein
MGAGAYRSRHCIEKKALPPCRRARLGRGLLAEIPRLEPDLGCINIVDFDDASRGLTRLVNFSPDDPLKDARREPSVTRLASVLEARRRELAGPARATRRREV